MQFIFCLIIFWWSVPLKAQALPPIQHYQTLGSAPFLLKDKGLIIYPESKDWLKNAAILLENQFTKKGRHWRLEANRSEEYSPDAIRFLPLEPSKNNPYPLEDKRFGESYRIEIGSDIKIFAAKKAGAEYAVYRLLDLLNAKHQLIPGTLVDYPDYLWRGVVINFKHISCGDPLTLKNRDTSDWLKCMQSEIKKFASMRFNLLGIQSPIFHRLNDDDIALLSKLFKLARNYNLEPMPHVGSKLWNIPKGSLNVNAIEGVDHKKASFIVQGNQIVSQESNDNLVANGNFELTDDLYWELDNKSWAPEWQLTGEPNENGNVNRFLSIQLPEKNKPWQSLAFPPHRNNTRILPVVPGNYYELGISIRSTTERKARIRVGVEQYNKNQQPIRDLNRYPVNIDARHQWQHRWIPVFVADDAWFLSIRLAPQNLTNSSSKLDLDDVELRPMQGLLVNVLNNQETSPVVNSADGKTIYKQGKDYRLTLGKLKEWPNKKFDELERGIVEILPESRLRESQKVQVRFDTLPLEYRAFPNSKYSPVSKYTYEVYQRIFHRLKPLAPLFLNVGMDEHKGGLFRDSRSRRLKWTNRKLFISYLNGLDDLLKSKDEVELPGSHRLKGTGLSETELVMWDDMLNPWHNGGEVFYQEPFGGQPGATSLFQNGYKRLMLNRDIILATWWYRDKDERRIVQNTPAKYFQEGYRFFISPWHQKKGVINWFTSNSSERAEGVLATTWDGREDATSLIACLSWNRRLTAECGSH